MQDSEKGEDFTFSQKGTRRALEGHWKGTRSTRRAEGHYQGTRRALEGPDGQKGTIRVLEGH